MIPVLALLLAAPASAFSPAFEAPLALGAARFSAAAGAQRAASDRAAWIRTKLGPFRDLLSAPGIDAAAMSAEAVARLTARRGPRALVVGESHGQNLEIAAGQRFFHDALDAGVRLKTLVREKNTFDEGEARLAARGVPVVTMRSQFQPAPDIRAALDAPGRGLVASYAGHAHTATALKDYFLYTLEEGKTWGYERGKRDMPTIEDALREEGVEPLIVAMATESRILRQITRLFLREAWAAREDAATAAARLRAYRSAWDMTIPPSPPSPGLRFHALPGARGVFVGLTAGARAPEEIDALIAVLESADARAWAGTDRLKLYEAIWAMRPGADGAPLVSYTVVLTKEDGSDFERVVEGGTPMAAEALASAR